MVKMNLFWVVLNAMFDANGWPDENLAGRAHLNEAFGFPGWSWVRKAIDRMVFWKPFYCRHESQKSFGKYAHIEIDWKGCLE